MIIIKSINFTNIPIQFILKGSKIQIKRKDFYDKNED